MTRRTSLRRHLVVGLLIYTAILTAVVAAHGYWVNERAERSVWESMLGTELEHFVEQRRRNPEYAWPDSDLLRLYAPGAVLPAAFATLPDGVSDEVQLGEHLYVVLVESRAEGRMTLALDITQQEQDEAALGMSLALSVLAVVLAMAALAYVGAGRLIQPLRQLSRQIPTLAPDGRGASLPVPDAMPDEVAVVAESVNQYRRHIKEHIDRERTFIHLASHELRTPVAVIAGSIEVALAQTQADERLRLRPLLLRAHRATQGMEELMTMLLALARDPDGALRDLPSIDVTAEIQSIVDDHAVVAKGKELELIVDVAGLSHVKAPAPVLRAVIGNLIRNAIENSDRGTIRIRSAGAASLVVEDTGHGMTAAEMATLHTRIARSGFAGGSGIGIGLITRLCEHFGWQLRLTSSPDDGTSAQVDFGTGSTPGVSRRSRRMSAYRAGVCVSGDQPHLE